MYNGTRKSVKRRNRQKQKKIQTKEQRQDRKTDICNKTPCFKIKKLIFEVKIVRVKYMDTKLRACQSI